MLAERGHARRGVARISAGDETILRADSLRAQVQLVINTITGGSGRDERGHRDTPTASAFAAPPSRSGIPCLTSLDTARAVVQALHDTSGYSALPLAEYRRSPE